MSPVQEFLFTATLGILLIALCCLACYEMLRFAWSRLPVFTSGKRHPHIGVLMIVGTIFAVHIMNIWLFGTLYYALEYFGLGRLTGNGIDIGDYEMDFFGSLYFSAVVYSTLGLGDLTPQGAMRMITGVESLTGFILIGWTVTFTYLAMQQLWELPHRKGR